MITLDERNRLARALWDFKVDAANTAMLTDGWQPPTPFHREQVEAFWTGHNLFHWAVQANRALAGRVEIQMVDGSMRAVACDTPVQLSEVGGAALNENGVSEVRAYWRGALASRMTPAEAAASRPCHSSHRGG